MVGELTVGKPKYADAEPELYASLARLSDLRERLVALVYEDAEAFKPVAAAYKMPKSTPEEVAAKNAAIQAALIPACEVPIAIMRACVDVINECELMVRLGSRLAISDAGAGALIAQGANVAASLNVIANIALIEDGQIRAKFSEDLDSLISGGAKQSEEVLRIVRNQLGA